jgi:pyrimidine deaminase RibD-like protein
MRRLETTIIEANGETAEGFALHADVVIEGYFLFLQLSPCSSVLQTGGCRASQEITYTF